MMPEMTSGGNAAPNRGLTQATAVAWVDRWDAQQQIYLADREERFTALIDAVTEMAELDGADPEPLILDLGCGPGSLSVRLLGQIRSAAVIGIDTDPLLLGLGRAARPGLQAAAPGRTGLHFARLDLAEPGWTAMLGLSRPVTAAVSTTALHWLTPDALGALYREIATVLAPGGLILNGDHLREDEAAAPVLARLGRRLAEREAVRRDLTDGPEDWAGWWHAVLADPALADLAAERARLHVSGEHHGQEAGQLAVHVDALRAAGFAEVGTLWQRGDNRLLCAVKAA